MALRDWIWIVLIGIAWGSSFTFNAILLEQIGPLSVALGRISLGALTCWAYVIATGRMTPLTLGILANLLLLGVLNYAVPFTLYPVAQAHIASGVAGIINAMTPIMVVIVSHFWPGGEKATWLKSIGVGVGFLGIVALASPAVKGGDSSEAWALMAAWAATLCYAVSLNLMRRVRQLHSSAVAALGLTFAAVILTPVVFLVEGVPTLSGVVHIGSLLVLGTVLTGVSFLILWAMLPRIGATNASVVTFIAPISALALGVLVLGESILPAHLLGCLMIFAGLLLIDGRLFRPQAKLN